MSPILGIVASGWDNTPTGAFESIATATGTGSSGTITFSSIPQTYTSLQVRFAGKVTGTAALGQLKYRFNNDTTTKYAFHRLSGDGSSVTAYGEGTATTGTTAAFDDFLASSSTSFTDIVSVGIIDIHDYTSTTRNKTVRSFIGENNNTTTAAQQLIALYSHLWPSASAITQIEFFAPSGVSFTSTSTFALYGIKGS